MIRTGFYTAVENELGAHASVTGEVENSLIVRSEHNGDASDARNGEEELQR